MTNHEYERYKDIRGVLYEGAQLGFREISTQLLAKGLLFSHIEFYVRIGFRFHVLVEQYQDHGYGEITRQEAAEKARTLQEEI